MTPNWPLPCDGFRGFEDFKLVPSPPREDDRLDIVVPGSGPDRDYSKPRSPERARRAKEPCKSNNRVPRLKFPGIVHGGCGRHRQRV
jgi:hypothetical protein